MDMFWNNNIISNRGNSRQQIKSNIINLKQGAYRNVSTLPFKIK